MTAETKLLNIQQRGSLGDYASDFSALASEVDWNEASLVMHFRKGLKSNILDMMVIHEMPTTLTEAMNLAIKIDQRIWENEQLQRLRNQPKSISKPQKSFPRHDVQKNQFQKTDPEAMDLDVSKRGPVSVAERQRRFSNNLCLYYGGEGHNRATCPVRPKSLNSSTIGDTGKSKDKKSTDKKEEKSGNGNGR
jgi:hypothetical protein